MNAGNASHPSAFLLSLRWKALIALSLVLLAVNAWLAFLVNQRAVQQFDLQQSHLRLQQVRQLRTMLDERGQEMSKLGSLVPLLGSAGPGEPGAQIRRALEENGALLDLEWDVRSVHWIDQHDRQLIAWPEGADPLPDALASQIARTPERTLSILTCERICGDFMAIPLLWQGRYSGTLVLERSLADALLAFSALTGAEIAIDTSDGIARRASQTPNGSAYLDFPALTYPERVRPVLAAAGQLRLQTLTERQTLLVRHDSGWFEIFRIPQFAPGMNAYVINEVTAQQESIRQATRASLLIGALGLLLSESLLLVIMKPPLYRLRDLAAVLPLLAEQRYDAMRDRLSRFAISRLARDEIDLMVETVMQLTDRMETLHRERELAQEQLGWLADHDPLTRLLNRRRFNRDFQRLLEQSIRYQHRGALLCLDLDEFKDVNDLSGHQVGDVMLRQVAAQLGTVTRSSDLLARLGGDEFALVLPESSLEGARRCAESVQSAIRSIVVHEQGRQHRVSASIGIVIFPDQGNDITQLLANGDLAMYQAKELGRGRWHLFSADESRRELLDARLLWREQITAALQTDRFELFVQPIVDIASGETCHQEALLRMIDEQGGLVFPDRFIPVAERTGQIKGIDHWVLRHAIRLLHERPGLRLAINLSANAMDDATIHGTLERLLADYALEPARLTVEVTETVAMSNLERATRLMRRIQDLGCRFALDDFGSGYASYAYLKQLPVDDIKIDGAFIRELPHSREDRIFVKAVTDMSHGMGRRVIAEFVETVEILDILRELGVDCAQGYYFGKPARLPPL